MARLIAGVPAQTEAEMSSVQDQQSLSGLFRTEDGCRIAWQLNGSPSAPVLVLSNSLGTGLAMWDDQLPAFCAKFRVLRYDSRGHGASAVFPGSYSIDRLGRDVIELLDELQIATVDFCGLSMGGMVGQWLGIHAPQRIKRLILSNTSSFMGPAAGWDARIDLVKSKGMAAVVDAVLTRWFTCEFLRSENPAISKAREMLVKTDVQGYAGCCAAIRDMDMRPSVHLIKRPTLVLAGSQDTATPLEQSEELADTIPNARLTVFQTAHLSNMEKPDLFTQSVLEFLGSPH